VVDRPCQYSSLHSLIGLRGCEGYPISFVRHDLSGESSREDRRREGRGEDGSSPLIPKISRTSVTSSNVTDIPVTKIR
jgi:hypothetical protein